MTDFDAAAALAPLKPFQRATVDHAIRRLLTDPDSVRQFLVADEVGLGKTMVARGVIARLIEKLQHTVPRLDIVYICSNGAIARQNVTKLDVLGEGEANILPTRLTLLALELMRAGGIRERGVNFFSLTPGTSLYLTSGHGRKSERALLLRMIRPLLSHPHAVTALFRCSAGVEGWFIAFETERRADMEKDEDSRDVQLVEYQRLTSYSTDAAESLAKRLEHMQRRFFLAAPDIELVDPTRIFSEAQRLAIYRRDGARCQLRIKCDGSQKLKWDHWHADHIKPHSLGGKTTVENGQVACPDCNFAKSNK
jgi:hypothetical protein